MLTAATGAFSQTPERVCETRYMDLRVSAGLVIPAAELQWRFSRSSGPGGQHVNTADTRVELSWNVNNSAVLSQDQRIVLANLDDRRVIDGVITISASEYRSQLRNRERAMEKLAALIARALVPPAAPRHPTKPTRGSARRHLATKQRRSATKLLRKPPSSD